MARYFGEVGFGTTAQTAPGVWEDTITAREYYGDVVKTARTLQQQENSVNDSIVVNNTIRIVADNFAEEHIFAIKYVAWSGALWKVRTAEVQRPRIILTLGEAYNGPTA